MPATCWEALVGTGLNPTGFEFQWQCRWRIWPYLVSDWLAGGLSEQTQPTTCLACSNGHECYRLGNDCKQFKLSHKPGVAGLNCGGWQYNKRNFTLLYYKTLLQNPYHIKNLDLECFYVNLFVLGREEKSLWNSSVINGAKLSFLIICGSSHIAGYL